MELSKREKRKLKIDKSRQQNQEAQKDYEVRVEEHKHHEHKKPVSKLKILGFSSLTLLILIIGYSIYAQSRPGPYDDFAKCLTEKGAVMYGAMDWCKFTQGQKAMFGKSFKHINYHEHTEGEDIKITPTWIINGKRYENTQSFEALSQATGCKV